MLPEQSLDEAHPNGVKLIALPLGQKGTETVSAVKTDVWADTSCVLPMKDTQLLSSVDHNAAFPSRSNSSDTSYIFSKLPFGNHLRSDSYSPLSFDQPEVTNSTPFRMRASSWDTVTKRSHENWHRIRTGSMDSKIKVKHPFIGPSLRLRDIATDVEENKGCHGKSSTLSQKATSAPPNPSPDLNSERGLLRVPKYGAITLPIYVYDCPLAMLMDVLVYRDTDAECDNKVCKDIYQDRTFKVSTSLMHNQPQAGTEMRADEGTVGGGEREMHQIVLDKTVTHTAAKHTSPEPKSEDSDGVPGE
jgi:hypothetical protein